MFAPFLLVPYVNAAEAAAFRTYPHAAGVEDMTVSLCWQAEQDCVVKRWNSFTTGRGSLNGRSLPKAGIIAHPGPKALEQPIGSAMSCEHFANGDVVASDTEFDTEFNCRPKRHLIG